MEQVKSELAGSSGDANPQESKLNLVEQLLKSAMMQTALDVKDTAETGGRGTPKGKEEETQTQPPASGSKRQKTDNITINREIFPALVHAVKEFKSPPSTKQESSEDEELVEDMEE